MVTAMKVFSYLYKPIGGKFIILFYVFTCIFAFLFLFQAVDGATECKYGDLPNLI